MQAIYPVLPLQALEKNSALKAALSYDQERRSKAMKLLLGLQTLEAGTEVAPT